MSFFNKKEEVIEVILTSYGKYKLSRGQWKPAYYAFSMRILFTIRDMQVIQKSLEQPKRESKKKPRQCVLKHRTQILKGRLKSLLAQSSAILKEMQSLVWAHRTHIQLRYALV